MSELLAALKRNLVNASGREAEVIKARIDAIEQPEPEPEPIVLADPDATFDGPDPYPAPVADPDIEEE